MNHQTHMKLPTSLTTVTTFSKLLALLLFILFPFFGFYLGMEYQKLVSPTIVQTVLIKQNPSQSPKKDNSISMYPTSGPINTQVTITGQHFTSDNFIQFGRAYLGNIASSDGTHLTFTVPLTAEGGCNGPDFSTHDQQVAHCMAIFLQQTVPGNYPIEVINSNGTSSSSTFTVTTQ